MANKPKKFLFFFLFVLLILYTATHSLVPYYLEHHYLPKIADNNGINLSSLHVDKIGLNGINLSRIKVGSVKEGFFSIDSIFIPFNHLLFKNREVEEVSLSGVNIIVSQKNGSFSIAGLQAQTPDSTNTSSIDGASIQETISQLPVRIKKFTILNSSLQLEAKTKTHTIPYSIKLHNIDYQNASLNAEISVFLAGKHIKLAGTADLSKNFFSTDIHSEALQMVVPSEYISTPDDLFGSFLVTISGHISGTLSPFSSSHRTDILLHNLHIQNKDMQISMASQDPEYTPATVIISGDSTSIEASIVNLNLQKPYPIIFDTVHLLMDFQEDGLTASGVSKMTLPIILQPKTPPLSYVNLTQETTFHIGTNSWELTSKLAESVNKGEEKHTISLPLGPVQIQSFIPTFLVSGKGKSTAAEFSYSAILHSFMITENVSSATKPKSTQAISAETIQAEGKIALTSLAGSPILWGDIHLSGLNVEIDSEDIEVNGNLQLSTDIHYDSTKIPPAISLAGGIFIKETRASLPKQEIEISEISAEIPFKWPISANEKDHGNFVLKTIKNQTYDFGNFSGKLELTEGKYHITSTYSSHVLDDFYASLTGSVDISSVKKPKAHLTLTVPKYSFQSNNSFLKNHFPELDFSGNFEFQGNLDAALTGFSGSASIDLSETNIYQEENDIDISGIDLHMPFPNINTLKSGSGSLSFAKARFGEMNLTGGKAVIQVESAKSFLIEKSSLNWAGGHVDIMGTRIKKDEKEQQITLYCDGLTLADILSQSGISSVSGKGKVNGKIPLIFKNGTIQFEDAFLYSTPGTGGSIKISNSDILLAGVPKNSMQYAQLDFAGEALKHFKYEWVTLDLKSVEGDAILAMKMEGKPSSPLPFKYDYNAGSFIRTPPESKGIDSPIALDVNFHLPLNKIINYGTSLKSLF